MEGTSDTNCLSHLWSPLHFKSHIHGVAQLEGSLEISTLFTDQETEAQTALAWMRCSVSWVVAGGLPGTAHSILCHAASLKTHLKRKTLYIHLRFWLGFLLNRQLIISPAVILVFHQSPSKQNFSIALFHSSLQQHASNKLSALAVPSSSPPTLLNPLRSDFHAHNPTKLPWQGHNDVHLGI